MNVSVIGHEMCRIETVRSARHVGADTAGLLYQENSGGHVPRVQAEFPERIEPSTGDIGKVHCR